MMSLRLATAAVASLCLLFVLQAWWQQIGCAQTSSTGLSSRFKSLPAPPLAPPCTPQALRRRFQLTATLLPTGLPGREDEPIHLTFATASVDELLTNWALHVRRLSLPAVVASMDAVVLARCLRLRVHCLPMFDTAMEQAMAKEASRQGQRDASSVNIRGNPTLFISLGARKVEAILMLLRSSGRPVVVSDTDVVWLQDPSALVAGRLPGYEDFAHADLLASTDCLDPEQVRAHRPCDSADALPAPCSPCPNGRA